MAAGAEVEATAITKGASQIGQVTGSLLRSPAHLVGETMRQALRG